MTKTDKYNKQQQKKQQKTKNKNKKKQKKNRWQAFLKRWRYLNLTEYILNLHKY